MIEEVVEHEFLAEISQFRNMACFNGWSLTSLRFLFQQSKLRIYRRHDVLVRQGSEIDTLYLIKEGEIELIKLVRDKDLKKAQNEFFEDHKDNKFNLLEVYNKQLNKTQPRYIYNQAFAILQANEAVSLEDFIAKKAHASHTARVYSTFAMVYCVPLTLFAELYEQGEYAIRTRAEELAGKRIAQREEIVQSVCRAKSAIVPGAIQAAEEAARGIPYFKRKKFFEEERLRRLKQERASEDNKDKRIGEIDGNRLKYNQYRIDFVMQFIENYYVSKLMPVRQNRAAVYEYMRHHFGEAPESPWDKSRPMFNDQTLQKTLNTFLHRAKLDEQLFSRLKEQAPPDLLLHLNTTNATAKTELVTKQEHSQAILKEIQGQSTLTLKKQQAAEEKENEAVKLDLDLIQQYSEDTNRTHADFLTPQSKVPHSAKHRRNNSAASITRPSTPTTTISRSPLHNSIISDVLRRQNSLKYLGQQHNFEQRCLSARQSSLLSESQHSSETLRTVTQSLHQTSLFVRADSLHQAAPPTAKTSAAQIKIQATHHKPKGARRNVLSARVREDKPLPLKYQAKKLWSATRPSSASLCRVASPITANFKKLSIFNFQ